MKPRKLLLLASLAFAMPFAQYSLALEVRDESIVISGQLTDAVVDEVEKLIRDDPQPVRRIIFRHCLGGRLGPAARLVRTIVGRQIHSVASLQVSSACALAFLAGRTRKLDPSNDFVLFGFHNARKSHGAAAENLEYVPRMIGTLTVRKFPSELVDIIKSSYAIDSGLMILIEQKSGETAETEFFACPAGSAGTRAACRTLPAYDLRAIGLLRDTPP